jgi:hypothetical protein
MKHEREAKIPLKKFFFIGFAAAVEMNATDVFPLWYIQIVPRRLLSPKCSSPR